MLSCPNGRRKNAIWEQYDSMVQLHTIAGPGEPAAIVEVPETERACVLTMEAEPYKCWTDPYTGAAEAMALSLRGVWLSGADALGMTNCLNFASPEFPEKFYELKECLRGLADTCRALDCPVVSGNVSLYNETANDRIYPTPLVVTAGLAVERTKLMRAGKTEAGDAVYLVGPKEGSLGATRYQEAKNGKPLGKTCAPDYEAEKEIPRRGARHSPRTACEIGPRSRRRRACHSPCKRSDSFGNWHEARARAGYDRRSAALLRGRPARNIFRSAGEGRGI